MPDPSYLPQDAAADEAANPRKCTECGIATRHLVGCAECGDMLCRECLTAPCPDGADTHVPLDGHREVPSVAEAAKLYAPVVRR